MIILINVFGPTSYSEIYKKLNAYKVPGEKPKVILNFGNTLRYSQIRGYCDKICDNFQDHFTFVDILQQPEFHISHVSDEEAVFLPHSGRRFLGYFSKVNELWDERKDRGEVKG